MNYLINCIIREIQKIDLLKSFFQLILFFLFFYDKKIDSDKERRNIHPGELLYALEMVAADTLHCSKVRAYLVTSKLIGMEPGGLVFLDYSGSSSPSSLSTQIQGQGQEQIQTQTQTQGQGQGQTQGQGHVSGFSTLKPIGDIVPEEGPVAVRYFHLSATRSII